MAGLQVTISIHRVTSAQDHHRPPFFWMVVVNFPTNVFEQVSMFSSQQATIIPGQLCLENEHIL